MGLDKLNLIQKELSDIKIYFRKAGPKRRAKKSSDLVTRPDRAKSLYSEFGKIINGINELLVNKKLSESDLRPVLEIKGAIQILYADILDYFESKEEIKMTNFDLKVAVSLLTPLDGSEDKTIQLIDAIQLYESMLDVAEHSNLNNFVLKTRLTRSAKLRLSQKYNTVKELIEDMRKHLLTKKSDTALQSKLTNILLWSKISIIYYKNKAR